MPQPGTTSFALLGLLAVQPWSAYELTRQMAHSVRYCWPVSESLLYEEPKRLAAMGYATVTHEAAGATRTRAVYRITPAGRQALRGWLTTEPADPRLEFEAVLRLLFADAGSTEDLVSSLRSLAAWAKQQYAASAQQCADHLDGGGPFPERLHIIALFAELYGRIYLLVDDWAARAAAEAGTWPDTRDVGLTTGGRRRLESLVADAKARGVLPR